MLIVKKQIKYPETYLLRCLICLKLTRYIPAIDGLSICCKYCGDNSKVTYAEIKDPKSLTTRLRAFRLLQHNSDDTESG